MIQPGAPPHFYDHQSDMFARRDDLSQSFGEVWQPDGVKKAVLNPNAISLQNSAQNLSRSFG